MARDKQQFSLAEALFPAFTIIRIRIFARIHARVNPGVWAFPKGVAICVHLGTPSIPSSDEDATGDGKSIPLKVISSFDNEVFSCQ